MKRITAFAQARWSKYDLLSDYKGNSELFLFQLSDEQGCDQILADGPFTFDNHPMNLKNGNQD